MNWISAATGSLIAFGLWGFFSKLTVQHIDAGSALVFQTLGVLFAGFIVLCLVHFRPATEPRGVLFALLTGLAYGMGCLLYFLAAEKGKITTIVTLTALYPVITILLSRALLNEAISFRQWSGILFALVAILLMAS